MPVTIDLTNYNALVNEPPGGPGTTGTLATKEQLIRDPILTPVQAALTLVEGNTATALAAAIAAEVTARNAAIVAAVAAEAAIRSAADALATPVTGLWTPVDASGAGLTLTPLGAYCTYAKIGPIVVLSANVTYPATANGAAAALGGLPYPCSLQHAGAIGYSTLAIADVRLWHTAAVLAFQNSSGAGYTNAQLTAKQFVFTIIYRTP